MKLNQFGQIAFDEWVKLSERFPNFELDVFQIMPDHIHGIISLNNVGAGFTPAQYQGSTPAQHAGSTPAQDPAFTPAQYADNVVSPIHADNIQNQNSTIGTNTQNQNSTIGTDTRATARVAPTRVVPTTVVKTGINTVGNIIGAYKSLVANGCLDIYKSKNKTMGKLWQRNYYERIIRDEHSYQIFADYILNNPAKWRNNVSPEQHCDS